MKRYYWTADGMELAEHFSPSDGDWVRYEDFAKLEAAARAVSAAFDKPLALWGGEQKALSELRKCLEGK